jgi:hypothetical protein
MRFLPEEIRLASGRMSSVEIGAGTAGFSRAFQRIVGRKKLVADVVEPSDRYAAVYRPFGFRHVAKKLSVLDEPRRYHVVQASHVLELRHYPNPPHLSFFTPDSLAMTMKKAGLEVVMVTTCGPDLEEERSVGFLEPGTGPAAVNSTGRLLPE